MNLMHTKDLSPDALFASEDLAAQWQETAALIAPFAIPDGTGGVNPGDRRAIYYLIRHLKPKRVLEVGTHIGASTLHIAAALEPGATMTTVDTVDVNSDQIRNWLKYDTALSPAETLQRTGLADRVQFTIDTSLRYLEQHDGPFDFVFLDGDHDRRVVAAEVPLVLERLTPGGVVLLHDYYPGNEMLWPPEPVIDGPFLAIEQLRQEGLSVRAVPLGELPWETRLGSNVTNLALLLRE